MVVRGGFAMIQYKGPLFTRSTFGLKSTVNFVFYVRPTSPFFLSSNICNLLVFYHSKMSSTHHDSFHNFARCKNIICKSLLSSSVKDASNVSKTIIYFCSCNIILKLQNHSTFKNVRCKICMDKNS